MPPPKAFRILFAFEITDLQKTLSNAHSSIKLKNNNIETINIKKTYSNVKKINIYLLKINVINGILKKQKIIC